MSTTILRSKGVRPGRDISVLPEAYVEFMCVTSCVVLRRFVKATGAVELESQEVIPQLVLHT
jgi:hypothetical protein